MLETIMPDAEYEWLQEKLGNDLVLPLRQSVRTQIRLAAENDRTADWESGVIYGFLRGLSACKVAPLHRLLIFKDRMYGEELEIFEKEREAV